MIFHGGVSSRLFDSFASFKSTRYAAFFQALHTPLSVITRYKVHPINPKSMDRYRDRYKVSGVKNDRFDAMVLANILRTDLSTLKPIIPNSNLARELKIFTRDREALIRNQSRLVNQLTSCLKAYYPLALELFGNLQSWISIAFITKYPTVQSAQRISLKQFKRFLKNASYTHPHRAEKLYEIIKKDALPVEPLVARSKSRLAAALIAQLKPLMKQVKSYDKEIAHFLAKHPDGILFSSLPGAADNLAARMLSEFGDNRIRYENFNNVQCEAGTAPITKESGGYRHVIFRRACNKHFRDALYLFAFSSLTRCLWAKKYYDVQRSKSKTHSRALRALSNQWVKIIFTMWKTHTVYDEQRYYADKTKHRLSQAA